MANESTITEDKGTSTPTGDRGADAGHNHGNGMSMSRLLLLGVAAGAGYLLLKQLPDLKRYLTMRSM